jgi:hypothetical protein
MKLEVHKNGTKLFFITFAVKGRWPILSRLVDEKSRPELLPLGELVKAAIRALHLVRAAIGTSDYVIMPDHVHFIMVVDYLRDRIASPLWLVHRLMDAVEMAVAAGWGEPTGTCGPRTPAGASAQASGNAGTSACALVGGLKLPTPEIMATYLRAACDEADRLAGYGASPWGSSALPSGNGAAIGGAGASAPVGSPPMLFERSPYIELAFDPRQLKAARRYIRLNPARALWKQRHPDRFQRLILPWHKVMRQPAGAPPPAAPATFHAMGNALLLASPFLFHVRLTLKKSVAEHEAAIAEIIEKARHGHIPVSGFISPGEKEALRRLKAEPRARFIKLLPCALPPRYDPSAEDSRELAADRLLILSGFPETPHLSPLEMRRNPAVAHAFRRNCLAMNDLAAEICKC